MSTPFLFKTITFHQIVTPLIHIPLLILDNSSLLLSLLQVPLKLKNVSSSSFILTLPQTILSSTASLVLVSCFTFFLLLYNIIFIVSKTTKLELTSSFPSKCLKLLILFYDLLFFRYLSSVILFAYSDLIIKSIATPLSVGFLAFALLGLIAYTLTMLYHIHKTFLVLHIDNKEMIKSSILYPFDEYSRRFDLFMLGVKVVGCVQYVSYTLHKDGDGIEETPKIGHYLPFFASYIFFVLNVLSVADFVVGDFFIKNKEDKLLINTKLNLVRIGIALFNLYTLILMLLFIDNSFPLTIGVSLFAMLLSLLWTIGSLVFIWNKVLIPKMFNGEISIRKIAFIIMREWTAPPEKGAAGVKGEPFLHISPSRMMNTFKLHHFIVCTKRCSICKAHYDNFVNVFSYLNFFRLLSKDKLLPQQEDSDFLLISVLSLLYFRFKKKPYTYYRQYQKKLSTAERLGEQEMFINYIELLFASFTNINNDSTNISLYLHITSLSALNGKIQSILTSIKDFIALEKSSRFEEIFTLSAQLVAFEKEAQAVFADTDNKTENDINEQMTRKIKNINHYNMLINRFITEKILNRPIASSNPMEADQLAEYFASHFDNDNFLMLKINKSNLAKETLSNIIILKSGHSLIDYETKTFNNIIPQRLEKEAEELFFSLLRAYDVEGEDNKSFDFIINNSAGQTVTYFKFQYDLLHLISSDSMLIYGFYTQPEGNVMLFENIDYDPDNLVLWRYNDPIQSLLMLPIKVLDSAREMNFFFTFENLFKVAKRKATIETHSSFNRQGKTIEYIFDSAKYFELLQVLIKRFNSFYSLNNCQSEELTNSINKIQLRNMQQTRLSLTLIAAYGTIKVFSVKFSSKVHQSHLSTSIKDENQPSGANELMNLNNTLASQSSLTDNNSMSSLNSYIKSQRNNRQQLLTLFNPADNNSSKTHWDRSRFWLIMKIITWFNILIIVLCVVFLIIQIVQLKLLFAINSLYIQLKQMRIAFTHVVLGIYTNVCIADSNNANCTNAYIDYSQLLLADSGLNINGSSKILLPYYLSYELKYKTTFLLNTFRNLRTSFYANGDKEVMAILDQQMNFTELIYHNDQLEVQNVVITFEQGLKHSINSVQVIQQHWDYITSSDYRVFKLPYADKVIDFSNVVPQLINQVQNELYLLVINYLNYSNSFSQGDRKLLIKFSQNETLDKVIIITQIVIIFLLNLILFFLCMLGFSLTKKVLFGFCNEMITLLSVADAKAFFKARIDNLLTLNRLYVKNPNSLIKSIAKGEEAQMKKNRLGLASKSRKESQITKDIDALVYKKLPLKDDSADLEQENTVIMVTKPYIKVTYWLFGLFFVFYITFSYFVLIDFLKVLDLAAYIQLNYQFESNIYTSIGITQIMTIISMTDRDIAYEYGVNPDELDDSYMNTMNKDTLYYLGKLDTLEKNYPSDYPTMGISFGNSSDCNSIMMQMNDSNFNGISQDVGLNYTKMVVVACEKLKVLSLPNFAFMYNDIVLKLKNLQNSMTNITFTEFKEFNKKDELFDLNTITLMIYRPIRFYIKSNVLIHRVASKTNQFIFIVAVFLSSNVFITLIIFIIIKWYVFDKLTWSNDGLISLKQALLMSSADENQ